MTMITPAVADQLTIRMFDDAHRQSLTASWGWRRRISPTDGGRIAAEAGSHRWRPQGWRRRGSPLAAR